MNKKTNYDKLSIVGGLMNKNTIYIISIIALVLAIIIFFIILRLSSLKKLRTKARELEKQRNLIVSTPIMSELSKI